MHNFKYGRFVFVTVTVIMIFICFAGCAMYASMTRSSWTKLAGPSIEDNEAKFLKADYNTYTKFKSSLVGSFTTASFLAYHFSSSTQYTSIEVSIYGSTIHPGELYNTMLNLFPDYYKPNGDKRLYTMYLIEGETVLTKNLVMELELDKALLEKPGKFKMDNKNKSFMFRLINPNAKISYSNKPDNTYLNFEVVKSANNQCYCKYSGILANQDNSVFYYVYEGELWMRL